MVLYHMLSTVLFQAPIAYPDINNHQLEQPVTVDDTSHTKQHFMHGNVKQLKNSQPLRKRDWLLYVKILKTRV